MQKAKKQNERKTGSPPCTAVPRGTLLFLGVLRRGDAGKAWCMRKIFENP